MTLNRIAGRNTRLPAGTRVLLLPESVFVDEPWQLLKRNGTAVVKALYLVAVLAAKKFNLFICFGALGHH